MVFHLQVDLCVGRPFFKADPHAKAEKPAAWGHAAYNGIKISGFFAIFRKMWPFSSIFGLFFDILTGWADF
ncbi:MAG: hypothetical protein AB7V14_12875 [Kiritimatiellia bacterium]